MDDKPRILGVDDSLTIRKALEIVLRPAGYTLELGATGEEAIDKAKTFKPSLILLDFILPDMKGAEVCRRLAEDPETSDIPVVLISAKGAEIRQAYQDIGNVVSYIAKPFKPQVVTGIVAEVLEKVAAGELIKSEMRVHEAVNATAAIVSPVQPAAVSSALSTLAAAASARTSRFDPAPARPANGGAQAYAGAQRADRSNGHEDLEEFELDEGIEAATSPSMPNESVRREMLEVMFETLRGQLEGVYVEEVDTPAGAAADQATSYTDLMERLGRELTEGLQHACSKVRYSLYGDGSLRSLDETLFDVFRRSCRLLFRAVVAGAVENEAAAPSRRILVACHHDSPLHEQLRGVLSAHPEWQAFTVSEGFRQLPLMVRLYGPTHVIADVGSRGALWDQLGQLQRMPEARGMTVIGIGDSTRGPAQSAAERSTMLSERGISRTFDSAHELERFFGSEGEAATRGLETGFAHLEERAAL
jgi:CheY-like chemotaxis protein